MNYIKIDKTNLTILREEEICYENLIEQLTVDELTCFYIKKNNQIIGILDKDDIFLQRAPSFDKDYILFCCIEPNSTQVQNLLNKKNLKKLIVFTNGELICEYRNLEYGYLPRQVYRNLMALRYLAVFQDMFIDKICRNSKDKLKIVVISHRDITKYLKKYLPFIDFHWSKTVNGINTGDKCDIWNFKYSRDYYRFLDASLVDRFVDFYYIAETIIFEVLIRYCKEKNIDFYFVKAPAAERLKSINSTGMMRYRNSTTLGQVLEQTELRNLIAQYDSDIDYLSRNLSNATFVLNNGFSVIESDIDTEHLHVKNGIRLTLPEIDEYLNEIHVYGLCTAFGFLVSDENTIESQLQNYYLINNQKTKIFNHGTNNGQILLCDVINALNTPVNSGDVFVFIYEKDPILSQMKVPVYDTCNVLNDAGDDLGDFFYDCPQHCNRNANALIARYLYDVIQSNWYKSDFQTRLSYFEENHIDTHKFDFYDITLPNLYSFLVRYSNLKNQLQMYHNVGAIVIHAAPYTNGHHYLVDTALKFVDALVIFVLGDFYHSISSLDRVEIVKNNVKNINNVFVIPLEPFATSATYFPAYAMRHNSLYHECYELRYSEGEIIDQYIFAFFDIKYRFLGEESTSSFMYNYNKLIIEEAHKFGIDTRVIPRKVDDNGEVISASKVRDALKIGNEAVINKSVSKITKDYIIENKIECH